MRRAIVLGLVAAGVLPGVASAHVGRTLPVATNFTARVTVPVAGIEAKVADGDQSLWLRVRGSAVVGVPGILGEPLLRFDARGVWLNLRSPTAQSDRIDRTELRPSASGRPPLWHRVTSGHAYLWHEHRLHALEPVGGGQWSVPVVLDGRRRTLGGVLDHHDAGAVWAWIAVPVVLALAAAVAATRSAAALAALALVATAAVWAIRVGRELYGRPAVPLAGWIEIAITCVIGALFVFGLTRRNAGTRAFTAFFVGFGALYEGLTMLPVLTHAIALNALPSTAARVVEAVVVAAGIGTLGGSVVRPLLEGEPA
ncbi:MAG TPA: hypothetical protein VGG88_09640 [Gaiellaceae bacterium]